MHSSEIIGRHPIIRKVASLAERLANTRHPVLISGEPGTGKLLVASVLHMGGCRREAPFVVLDCRDERADRGGERIASAVASAVRGTLFLKNVEWLDEAGQEDVLAALAAQRVGDVRLVISRSRIPTPSQGELFPEFAARTGALELILPPLRERRSDIPGLVEHFIATRCGQASVQVDDATALALWRYDWPGNVRQLRDEVEAALDRRMGGLLHPECLSAGIARREAAGARQRELRRFGPPLSLFVPALGGGMGAT